jgi:hypothetical protein
MPSFQRQRMASCISDWANAAGTRLVWFDRSGKQLKTFGEPAVYRYVELSPDGKQVGVEIQEGRKRDIWLYNVEREIRTRFTFGLKHPDCVSRCRLPQTHLNGYNSSQSSTFSGNVWSWSKKNRPARLAWPLHGNLTVSRRGINPDLPIFFLWPITDTASNHTFYPFANFRV